MRPGDGDGKKKRKKKAAAEDEIFVGFGNFSELDFMFFVATPPKSSRGDLMFHVFD